jgi:hypothetical protein
MSTTEIDSEIIVFDRGGPMSPPIRPIGKKAKIKNTKEADRIFDKSSAQISNLL